MKSIGAIYIIPFKCYTIRIFLLESVEKKKPHILHAWLNHFVYSPLKRSVFYKPYWLYLCLIVRHIDDISAFCQLTHVKGDKVLQICCRNKYPVH